MWECWPFVAMQGFRDIERVAAPRNPYISVHGSFSMPTNFHALDRFVESHAGVVYKSPYLEGFAVDARGGCDVELCLRDGNQSGDPSHDAMDDPPRVLDVRPGVVQRHTEVSEGGEQSLALGGFGHLCSATSPLRHGCVHEVQTGAHRERRICRVLCGHAEGHSVRSERGSKSILPDQIDVRCVLRAGSHPHGNQGRGMAAL